MKYKLLMLMLLVQLTAMAQKSIQVADLKITAPASIANPQSIKPQDGVYHYGFQQGDAIVVNVEPEKAEQPLNLEVQEYTSGSTVFSVKNQKKIKNLRLPAPRKIAYRFILTSANGKPVPAQLSIKRTPANEESRYFNPNITWKTKSDTTWTTVTEKVAVKGDLVPVTLVDKTFRVASKTNLNPSRVAVPFKLPANTVHWVYWIGVGQESVEQLKNMTSMASKGAATLASTVSPVAAFGLGLIPSLPQVNASGNIDYYFMNKQSADKFVADPDSDWKHYTFAQGTGIISDYKLVQLSETPKATDNTLHAVFRNSNTVTGLDITLKIVAFEQEKKYVSKQVRKPLKVELTYIPAFGE
ncbi:hypothetical protein [Pontibacter cellulosilyticus]|uniref:Uncharacterized protein n=1 Tax=Pontibacter cellulosilyticus TaxID=1720253 RepID=A0A923N7H0_9BACT|nr:hypothetical protein [Pontibacter cellulosilyticus]MBC5994108.1 hypothetical protein [Pontibacter cellulosilyticus]